MQKGSSIPLITGDILYTKHSISLSAFGNRIAIGEQDYIQGVVRIFELMDDDWTQIDMTILGEESGSQLGKKVSLSEYGDRIAISSDGTSDSPYVKVYDLTCPTINSTDDIISCEVYTWIYGITYTENNNTAQHIFTNEIGCEITKSLNLTIGNNESMDNITSCEAYSWIDGNTYTESNSTATYLLTNQLGCDSLVTLNLTIGNNESIYYFNLPKAMKLSTPCTSFKSEIHFNFFVNDRVELEIKEGKEPIAPSFLYFYYSLGDIDISDNTEVELVLK